MLKDALTPQARHHFTRFDQVNQLAAARETAADLGFMARLLALCSLPRTNERTQAFAQRKVASGKSKLEAIRCIK